MTLEFTLGPNIFFFKIMFFFWKVKTLLENVKKWSYLGQWYNGWLVYVFWYVCDHPLTLPNLEGLCYIFSTGGKASKRHYEQLSFHNFQFKGAKVNNFFIQMDLNFHIIKLNLFIISLSLVVWSRWSQIIDLSSNFFKKYKIIFSNPQALLHCF